MMKLIIILTLALIFVSCSNSNDPVDIYGIISGRVISSVDGIPVSNVEVSAFPPITTNITLSDGRFRFVNIKEGSYSIIAYKNGYKLKTVSVQVNPGKSVPVDIILIPNDSSGKNGGNSIIKGKIVNSLDNRPIENAVFKLEPGNIMTNSDNNGNFIFSNVQSGTFTVTAMKNGFLTKQSTVVVEDNSTNDVNFGLQTFIDIPSAGNPILKMMFDDNYNDLTGNSIPKSYQTRFVNDRNNKPNSAVFFDGSRNSYIMVPYSYLYDLNEFTYSFWIKPEQGYGVEYRSYIDVVSRWGSDANGAQTYNFAIGPDGSFKAMLFNPNYNPYYTFINTNSNSIKANVWTFVAITYSNQKTRIYLNGELSAEQYSVIPQSSNYGIMIGKTYEIIEAYYHGAFDDLILFDKALSDSEIKALYK